jgi:hypothetical protein
MLYFRIEAKFNPDNFDHGEIPSKAVQWGSGLNNFNQSLENNVSPNPSYVVEAGKVLFLRVQGSAGPDSGIWGGTASNGTDRNFIYRDRTAIKLAAVHAGLLGDGEYGILKVTFIEEQATSFIGSTQNEGTQDEIESLNVNPDGAPYSYMIEFHSED